MNNFIPMDAAYENFSTNIVFQFTGNSNMFCQDITNTIAPGGKFIVKDSFNIPKTNNQKSNRRKTMRQKPYFGFLANAIAIIFLVLLQNVVAQSTLDCKLCHRNASPPLNQWTLWETSRHANTQNDVADELAANWAGQSPDSVINGSQAENCVSCHSPVSVSVLGGMTEVQVMNHFFSTTNGVYTNSTHAIDTANWPHVACVTCHNVSSGHPTTVPTLSIFNSTTAQYDSVSNSSELCGQCHGTLRYAESDHRILDAWKISRHGHDGQVDVAGELAAKWAGSTPDEVASEENCIGCHASTSVLLNGGISESAALALFFTTSGGVFTQSTTPQNTKLWPEVSCTSCHNQHNPDLVSYFNSGTKEFEVMPSSQELCGQCHGNLRFPETDHLSYNIEQGTGGQGVPDQLTMPGVKCVDCHMHAGDIDGTNASMFKGHSWSVFIQENDGTETASCTSCHGSISANIAELIVRSWQDEYAILDSVAILKVNIADSLLSGSSDTTLIHLLAEAKFNLAFAQGDESAGAHNNIYTNSLLNDAIAKANVIITGIGDNSNPIVNDFILYQNYPNPFNPSSTISFSIPSSGLVTLKVYDALGKEVSVLLNEVKESGSYNVRFNAENLSSGIYLYKIQSGNYTATKKMILMK